MPNATAGTADDIYLFEIEGIVMATIYNISVGLPTVNVVFKIIMYLKYFGRITRLSVCMFPCVSDRIVNFRNSNILSTLPNSLICMKVMLLFTDNNGQVSVFILTLLRKAYPTLRKILAFEGTKQLSTAQNLQLLPTRKT